ncbi:Hypothetical protein CINCED_3A001480 [Cinara cedri]|uniref:Uncharacterized protein n=1 Tax=Cinara cedri TaxID=506608 RepID=A0A5E4NI90_9HEMI|nr:Hypothetical protein CINCED_3A001480 [Cinara cedri]
MESTVVTLSENDETPEQITKIKNIKYQQPEIDNQELETFSYSNIDKSAQHLLLALDDFKHYQELKNDLMPENRIIQIVYSFLYHLVQTVCVLRENVQELPSSSLNLINYSSRILKQSFSFFGVSDLFSNYMSDKLRVTKKLLSTNTEITYCSNKMNEDPTYDIRIIKLVYELLCNTDNTLLMNLNVVMKHFYDIIPPEWQESDMLECKKKSKER